MGPKFIDMEPASGCNLRCRMCHVSYDTPKPRFLDLQRVADWDFLQDRTVSIGAVYEPSIHPQFNELLGIVNSKRCRLHYVTNAKNLSRKDFSNLYDAEIEILTISFDGASKETYEYIRRGGSFDEVFANTKKLIGHFAPKGTICRINFTVGRANMHEILDAVKLWESVGAQNLNLISMVTRAEEDYFAENSLWDVRAQFFAYLEEAANYVIDKGLKISLTSPYFAANQEGRPWEGRLLGGHYVASENNTSGYFTSPHMRFNSGASDVHDFACRAATQTARIDFNGDVFVCHNVKIGNLYDASFDDIWAGAARADFIESLKRSPKTCERCDYFRLCIASRNLDLEQQKNYYAGQMVARRAPAAKASRLAS